MESVEGTDVVNSLPVEQVEPEVESESVDMEEEAVEYRQIDEPEAYDSHEEAEHDHNHEQETEVRALDIPAPDFNLKTLTGDTVKLADLKGKKVFINFWATWCPPCVEEMPAIQQFYEQHGNDENLVILAVNATDLESDIESVQQFVDKNGIGFPILLDEKGDVSINYEVLTIPTSVILNEEGKVIEQIIGPVSEEMLEEKLINS
ncbi:MAG TPA: TlpA disulfide reductase family protein [Ureibacillus sp.]|nr:TlpA disulfide reductase family protein [Ureibacillus sp.]